MGHHLCFLKNTHARTSRGTSFQLVGDGCCHTLVALARENLLIPTALPQQLRAQTTKGRGGKRPHPTSASTTTARDDGSDSDGEEAAQRTQAGLGSLCSLWGTCNISQIQDNSHQSQVIGCNIVAGSCSRFAVVCDVLGLPQSTAGERYEISIYIPRPGQQSDN